MPLGQGRQQKAPPGLRSGLQSCGPRFGQAAGPRTHRPPAASQAAVTLWLAARDRTVRGKVLAAVCSEELISIDGTPAPFLTLTATTGHWVAVRRHNDLVITIAASDLDRIPITLEPIPDPAAALLGPRPSGADVWPELPDPGA